MQLLDIGPAVPLNAIMSVLTIQSRVASGYVGNSIAVPAMQVNGVEAIAVDTVHFSNHPAHSSFEGCPVAAEKVRALLRGVEVNRDRDGLYGRCELLKVNWRRLAILHQSHGYNGESGTTIVDFHYKGAASKRGPPWLHAYDGRVPLELPGNE